MSEISLPLGLSVAGHAVCLALLILLLPAKVPPAPEPLAEGGIEVAFEPLLPKPVEPPVQAEMPPPPAEPPPPEPEPPPPPPEEPVAATEPPPPPIEAPAPVVEPLPPPTPPKPEVKPPPKPAVRRVDRPATRAAAASAPSQPASAAVAPPQTAYAPTPVPAPVPSTEVSPGYRALLSAWLESHKRYPDSARQRGEEGRAVLRFAIDRSGRVLASAVAQSTGHPDLDASLEEMMRDAVLPPFPAGMTQPRIDVSVTIRFSLAH